MLGFLGAFCSLNPVSRGSVALVATLSTLYPVVSVILAVVFFTGSGDVKTGVGHCPRAPGDDAGGCIRAA